MMEPKLAPGEDLMVTLAINQIPENSNNRTFVLRADPTHGSPVESAESQVMMVVRPALVSMGTFPSTWYVRQTRSKYLPEFFLQLYPPVGLDEPLPLQFSLSCGEAGNTDGLLEIFPRQPHLAVTGTAMFQARIKCMSLDHHNAPFILCVWAQGIAPFQFPPFYVEETEPPAQNLPTPTLSNLLKEIHSHMIEKGKFQESMTRAHEKVITILRSLLPPEAQAPAPPPAPSPSQLWNSDADLRFDFLDHFEPKDEDFSLSDSDGVHVTGELEVTR
jgi:hypothetical protein